MLVLYCDKKLILYFHIYKFYELVTFLFTEEHNVNSFSENIIANAGTDDVTADEINSSVKKRKRGYVSNNFSNPHCL